MSRRAAICILAVVLWAGCRRSTGPDANYQRAFTLYQQLYATQLDDAYGDPRMDEVVALLRAVDSRSSDAQPAQNLLGTIERGKDALVRDRAEREKATAAVRPPAPVTNFDTSKMFAALETDAGTQGGDPFGPGASLAELTASSGGCLAPNEPFTGSLQGEAAGPVRPDRAGGQQQGLPAHGRSTPASRRPGPRRAGEGRASCAQAGAEGR